MAYYLWGNVKLAEKDQQSKGVKHKTLTAGTEVSQSDFNEEDWDTFTKSGLIRKVKYPNVRNGESVRSALLRKAKADYAAATAAGMVEPEEVDENDNDNEENDNTTDTQRGAQKKPWE